MRGTGVPEEFITGSRGSYEKFEKWAETVPYTMRNLLYNWTHIELARVFGVYDLLSPKTARKIYDVCTEKFQTEEFKGRELMKRFNAKVVCTLTILYNPNPKDNEVLANMACTFDDGTAPGKIQLSSGWWFPDHEDGMRKQMNALSDLGLISRFVGMLTASRSFLSYPRREYFRRILCDIPGEDMEKENFLRVKWNSFTGW